MVFATRFSLTGFSWGKLKVVQFAALERALIEFLARAKAFFDGFRMLIVLRDSIDDLDLDYDLDLCNVLRVSFQLLVDFFERVDRVDFPEGLFLNEERRYFVSRRGSS